MLGLGPEGALKFFLEALPQRVLVGHFLDQDAGHADAAAFPLEVPRVVRSITARLAVVRAVNFDDNRSAVAENDDVGCPDLARSNADTRQWDDGDRSSLRGFRLEELEAAVHLQLLR
jgi:hypothetical protein